MSKELVNALADMREEEAFKLAREMVESGADPMQILNAAKEAMGIVGQRFQEGSYFLSELVLAGEMLAQLTDLVKPEMAKLPTVERHGKVLIGTVSGDIHDIGKNIVTFMLDVNGFEVLDLGVDVSPAKFVEATREFEADVVGMSGFLTLAYEPMKATIEALKEAGLRDEVKVMIGGIPVGDPIKEYTGADDWGKDAMAAVSLAKAWMGGK